MWTSLTTPVDTLPVTRPQFEERWTTAAKAAAAEKDNAGRNACSRLLAVDAGLRAGIAVYGSHGRLERYRSTNFGSVKRLRSAVYGVMSDVDGLERVVIEGGGAVAEPWMREAKRRGLVSSRVQAGEWRDLLLLPRNRRTGAAAKEQADELARRVIEWSEASRPTSLRHDAAEAILIGLWGVLEAGWLPKLPETLEPG